MLGKKCEVLCRTSELDMKGSDVGDGPKRPIILRASYVIVHVIVIQRQRMSARKYRQKLHEFLN